MEAGLGLWPAKGLSADANGNIYAVTGNGSFDGDRGGSSRGNSVLKLSPSGALLDWFTPFNWEFLNSTDQDLGSQGALLVPNTNLLVGGGKEGILYVLNRDDLGRFPVRQQQPDRAKLSGLDVGPRERWANLLEQPE